MIRLTMVLVALLGCLPSVHASFSPRHEPAPDNGAAARRLVAAALPQESKSDGLVVNDDTDVRFDGKKCKYEEVPANAEIILLELNKNQKMIQKIHFQTKKP